MMRKQRRRCWNAAGCRQGLEGSGRQRIGTNPHTLQSVYRAYVIGGQRDPRIAQAVAMNTSEIVAIIVPDKTPKILCNLPVRVCPETNIHFRHHIHQQNGPG